MFWFKKPDIKYESKVNYFKINSLLKLVKVIIKQ